MEKETGFTSPRISRVFVWDVPTRLFHWILLVLIIAQVITAKALDDAIELHASLGVVILALILFRLMWGVAGGSYARFAHFVRGPAEVAGFAHTLFTRRSDFVVGHNPLGGWMIVVLLIVVLAQALLGLFTNDDIMFEGPLAYLVSKETSDYLTALHGNGFQVLLVLVGLHVAAVIWHTLFKGENLVSAMFTGYKELPAGVRAEDARGGGIARALILLGASAALVYWLVA